MEGIKTHDAFSSREMRIRDDEIRKLRSRLYDIRELIARDLEVFKDTPIGDRLRKVHEIADGELWPG